MNPVQVHVSHAAGLTESQARLSKHLAARLVQRCPQQLPSPAVQKAAELLSDNGTDSGAPVEDAVSQLCGAAVAADTPSTPADEPDAREAGSRAQCTVQVCAACLLTTRSIAAMSAACSSSHCRATSTISITHLMTRDSPASNMRRRITRALNILLCFARQGVSFTLPRCAATLLLCTGPQAHRCTACGRPYTFPFVRVPAAIPASCYFCGLHLEIQDVLGYRK